jgi:hypothetical protein
LEVIMQNRRVFARFHPALGARARLDLASSDATVTCHQDRLVDISQIGCGFEATHSVPPKGATGRLTLEGIGSPVTIENVTVKWTEDKLYGVYFLRNEAASTFQGTERITPRPDSSQTERQRDLAKADIARLTAEVLQLRDCQTRIFITCLTISLGLLSLLPALGKVPIATQAIVASLPALLAAVCYRICVLKSISVNRLQSFVMFLQQQMAMDALPRYYRGWEDAKMLLLNCKMVVHGCPHQKICLKRSKDAIDEVPLGKRVKGQSLAYGGVLTFGFILVGAFSLYFTISLLSEAEIWAAQSAGMFFFLGCTVTAVASVTLVWTAISTLSVLTGRSSFLYYLNCWENILTTCSEPFGTPRLAKQR